MAKMQNQVKTDYGNIDKWQYIKSIMMNGKMTIHRFQKWLDRENKKLKTNLTIDDFK